MIRKGSVFGEILEQGGSIVKQTGKQAVKLPSDLAKTAATQTGAAPQVADQGKSVDTTVQKKQREELVKGLYGISDKKQTQGKTAPASDQPPQQKTPEELQKLAELRQRLHSEYYQRLVNPPKPKEERPAEKVEREKMEELQEVQKKEEKKPPPLPQTARPGTVERKLGSG